jgi:capsid protein
LDVSYGAYVVKGAYSGSSAATGGPEHDEGVASILELSRGHVEAIRKEAREISTSVSLAQRFRDDLDAIKAKLEAMEQLTGRASGPDHNEVKVEEMQGQFGELAKLIEETSEKTKHKFNSVFDSEGKSFSLAVGDGSHIDILAKDVSFDATGLDLTTDPVAAKLAVTKAIEEMNEYDGHLDKQIDNLMEATDSLEQDLVGAMGVEVNDFTPELAGRAVHAFISEAAKDQEKSGLIGMQANVDPERTLQLLTETEQKDTGIGGETGR